MSGRSPPYPMQESIQIMLTNPKPKVAPDGYTKVTRYFEEYDPTKWMTLIKAVSRDFGSTGKKWQWIMNGELSIGNKWVVDFYFLNPHDATIFQLKY